VIPLPLDTKLAVQIVGADSDISPSSSLDPGRLANRIDGLEALLRRLERRVDGLFGTQQPKDDVGPSVVVWQNLSPAGRAEELEKLADWVDWLQERYAIDGDWLRPCWWRHGFVVDELASLHSAWFGVYQSDKTIGSRAALDWHEAAARCRERIHRAISAGPGCTAVNHRLDEPVTDDPHWAEERAALHSEMPNLPRQPGAGAGDERLGTVNGDDRELAGEDPFRQPPARSDSAN
jgi:hypothetical protein